MNVRTDWSPVRCHTICVSDCIRSVLKLYEVAAAFEVVDAAAASAAMRRFLRKIRMKTMVAIKIVPRPTPNPTPSAMLELPPDPSSDGI